MEGLWIFGLFAVLGGILARAWYLMTHKFFGKILTKVLSFAIVVGFLVLGVSACRSFVETT